VVAAVFALGAIIFADKPADREHPYGHGKIEHFSAAFEGGMISLAAVLIGYEAIRSIVEGVPIQNLTLGLGINFAAGVLNGLLGLFLVYQGKRQQSQALEADGHHVFSDFYVTLGLAAGLLLVKATGMTWLDPAMALAVCVVLAFTGFKLVRTSSAALLDTEDPELLQHLVEVMNRVRPKDIVAIHELLTLLDSYQPGHLAAMLRAERDLVRARLAASEGDAAAAVALAAAITYLREQSTPYHLAHGLLDQAGYLTRRGGGDAAALAVDEARVIGRRLRCQPLLDRADDLELASSQIRT